MNYHTLNQKGSPSRDLFKLLHKKMMPPSCWALDSDLELVEKFPFPFIVARLDFKVAGDIVSFTEAISYSTLINCPPPHNVPVYIIEASPIFRATDEPEHHRFNIYRLLYADYRPNPPKTEMQSILHDVTWEQLAEWEMELRRQRKAEIKIKPAIKDLIHTYEPSPGLLEDITNLLRTRWKQDRNSVSQRDINWLKMWKAWHDGQRPWQVVALEQLSMDELEEMQP